VTRPGYCFRCDAPAEGDACPRCGARLYHEPEKTRRQVDRPATIGEEPEGDLPGFGRRVILVIVLVALLLLAIAVVAASTAGVA